jgi:surface-anchored protein
MKIKRIVITSLIACACCVGTQPLKAQSLWTSGHGDLGIGYEGGELEPHWHLDANANLPTGEYEPVDVMPQTGLTEVRNASSDFDFIGVSGGSSFYLFPQSSIAGTPFLGIGTEELTPADWNGDITLTLTGISGSGVTNGGFFSLYQVDGLGNLTNEYMATNGGISAADAVSVAPDTHTHYNWAFTELGRYDLTFDVTGDHATNGAETATATYSFNVIPEPSSFALLGMGLGALVAFRRRKK